MWKAGILAAVMFALPAHAELAAQRAVSVPANHAAGSARGHAAVGISPYARAAAQHSRAAVLQTGRAPTLVQSMGRPHRANPGRASK
jgi:hypothetical protein